MASEALTDQPHGLVMRPVARQCHGLVWRYPRLGLYNGRTGGCTHQRSAAGTTFPCQRWRAATRCGAARSNPGQLGSCQRSTAGTLATQMSHPRSHFIPQVISTRVTRQLQIHYVVTTCCCPWTYSAELQRLVLPLASRGHEAARRGQGDLLCRLKRVRVPVARLTISMGHVSKA